MNGKLNLSKIAQAMGLSSYLRDGKLSYQGLEIYTDEEYKDEETNPEGVAFRLVGSERSFGFTLTDVKDLRDPLEEQGDQLRDQGREVARLVGNEAVSSDLPEAISTWTDGVVSRLQAIEARLKKAEDSIEGLPL